MGLALAFFYSWLILIAGAALLITIGGLLFEYYVGQNAQRADRPPPPRALPASCGRGPRPLRAVSAGCRDASAPGRRSG